MVVVVESYRIVTSDFIPVASFLSFIPYSDWESRNLDDEERGMIGALDPQTDDPTERRYSREALSESEYACESGRFLVEMQIMILLVWGEVPDSACLTDFQILLMPLQGWSVDQQHRSVV